MIKGKTKIILTDVNTGKEEIYEDENTFQSDVISKVFETYGAFGADWTRYSPVNSRPLFQHLIGGLLIFDEEQDVGDAFMKSGTKMIGKASYGVTNSGNPTELGSFNESESSYTDDTIGLVYDFTTSQANGAIKSVCLTSNIGGLIGYGNTSYNGNNLGNTYYPDSTYITGSRETLAQYLRVYDENGDYYQGTIMNNICGRVVGTNYTAAQFGMQNDGTFWTLWQTSTPNGTLTFRKINFNLKSADLVARSTVFEDFEEVTLDYSAKNFTNTDAWGNYYRITRFVVDGTKFIFIANATNADYVSPSGQFEVLIFNLANETVTKKVVTNNTGYNIYIGTSYTPNDGYTRKMFMTDSNTVVVCNENGIYTIDIDTSVATRVNNTPVVYENDDTNTWWICSKISDGVYWLSSKFGEYKSYVYDSTNHTIYPTNAQGMFEFDKDMIYYMYCFGSGTDVTNISFAHNPLYLATINNLGSTINKSSTQTMKVVYTLTKTSS